MDKMTRRMLLNMPAQMLSAWEKKQLGYKTLEQLEKRLEWVDSNIISRSMSIGLILGIGTFLIGKPDGIAAVASVVFVLLLYGGSQWLIGERRRLESVFVRLEIRLAETHLGFSEHVRRGYTLPQVCEVVHYLLTAAAQEILITQDEIAQKRKSDKWSEDDLEHVLKIRRHLLTNFDRMLGEAREFGIEPWERRRYFDAATVARIEGKTLDFEGQPSFSGMAT